MSLRSALGPAVLMLLVACVPREKDPYLSDIDGDDVNDAFDQCPVDSEDFDGFEDEDGCPESGVASAETPSEASETQIQNDPKTTKRVLPKREKPPLRLREAWPNIRPFRRAAQGAVLDEQERGAVIFGFGKSWISSGKTTQLVPYEVHRASFAANGKHVGLVTPRGFLIASVSDGKTIRQLPFARGTEDSPETKLIRIGSDGKVLYFDGCQLFATTTAVSNEPTPLSAPLCGSPLVSEDAKTWLVWQRSEDARVLVYKLSLEGGAPSLVLGGRGDAPGLSQLVLSPNGRYLCYSRHRDGSELTCRDSKEADDLSVWKGPTDRRATFFASGALAFGAGPLRSERDLYRADLDTLALEKLGRLEVKDEWLSAMGKDSVVASGGTQLLIFDHARGARIAVPLGSGEWEGFSSIPGNDREFIIGKERRATRDLFRVTISAD